MAIPVDVPKFGNSVEECVVSHWTKHAGETVAAGELVAEIETDKATFELTAPEAGTILATFFEEGASVPVFTTVFVIGTPGEDAEAFRPREAGVPSAAPLSATSPDVAPSAPAPTSSTPSPGELDRAAAASSSIQAAFSPRARRFANERGFTPASVQGSGPGGRVLEQDLRDLYLSLPSASGAARAQTLDGAEAPLEGSGPAGTNLAGDFGTTPTRLPNIRERIARRMRESLGTTAQYTLNSSADAGGLLRLRARIKQSDATVDITLNALVAFCTIKAVLALPDVNALFVDGALYKHTAAVHLGFACDTPRGLLVPVVRNAHRMSVGELALRMKELAAQATQGTIAADDLDGATFTVSNLGHLGIESFTPLINPPQVAILGVDAIQLRPVRRNGTVEFIDSIGFSLTCDHQIVDGAPGARFLKALREKVEHVETLCSI